MTSCSFAFYRCIILALLFFAYSEPSFSQVWEVLSYPDEDGYRERKAPMLERIAAKDFGKRSLAPSRCPDTGLPVFTWAIEGEEIISPYTGRKYIQGPTGYFGPRSRNSLGQIDAFGGDPLKYDLPPATASFLLNQRKGEVKAFLSIPGNLSQQYHFACNNWARFYPLLADSMGTEWKKQFAFYVGKYAEVRRPSDGEREWLKLSNAHNLVGQPGYLLGGNPIDGGTENHKTMWRTSALLYSQILPNTCKISGFPVHEAESLTKEMLRDYLKRLLVSGNGEYDSNVYYPYTIEGFLNLYDFSPDAETRQLAKFALDYYFVTYGLKTIGGMIAGPQKRGYLSGQNPDDMEIMMWLFFGDTPREMNDATARIHQVTTTYRPNELIYNIVRKNIKLPFEASMSRPFYHMDRAHAFAETFYCTRSFGLGNMYMTIVDNPNQQVVWSLVTRGDNSPLCFSGGQPLRGSTSGHSPYTQTMQSKGSLILMTAPTKFVDGADTLDPQTPDGFTRANYWLLPAAEQGKYFEVRNRQKYGSKPLHSVSIPSDASSPDEIEKFWNNSKNSASSWLWYPSEIEPVVKNGRYYFITGEMILAVTPLSGRAGVVAPSEPSEIKSAEARKFFSDYNILVSGGQVSGFVAEAAELSRFGSVEEFDEFLRSNTKMSFNARRLSVTYRSASGDLMKMNYNPEGLRCESYLNGVRQDFDNFTGGAVYKSPFLNIENGLMQVSDGQKSYCVDFTGELPVWKEE